MNDVTVIEDLDVIEPNGNVISFSKQKPEDSTESFNFAEFLNKMSDKKDDIEDFLFIGVDKNGDTSVSAKAQNNMHLYWIVKRFMTHLERNLFE